MLMLRTHLFWIIWKSATMPFASIAVDINRWWLRCHGKRIYWWEKQQMEQCSSWQSLWM
jgi:hypothetical protein